MRWSSCKLRNGFRVTFKNKDHSLSHTSRAHCVDCVSPMLRCCSAAADWCPPPSRKRPAAPPRSAPGRSTRPRPPCSTPAGSKPDRPRVDDTPPGFAAGAPLSAGNKEVKFFSFVFLILLFWRSGQCQRLDTFLSLAGIPAAWVTICLKVGSVFTQSFCLLTSFSVPMESLCWRLYAAIGAHVAEASDRRPKISFV